MANIYPTGYSTRFFLLTKFCLKFISNSGTDDWVSWPNLRQAYRSFCFSSEHCSPQKPITRAWGGSKAKSGANSFLIKPAFCRAFAWLSFDPFHVWENDRSLSLSDLSFDLIIDLAKATRIDRADHFILAFVSLVLLYFLHLLNAANSKIRYIWPGA